MLENNNGRAVRQIIFRTISFRRARNTILVFLIFCCMSVLTLLGMGIAAEFEHLHATLLKWQGTDAHLILEGVTKEEKERIQIQPQVRKIGAADVIGEVKNPELIYRRPKMICPDKMFLKQNRRGALHGSLPEKEDEIVVDETTLTDLGVNKKVGETVKLVWEKDGKKMESSFVLSGYLEMKGADGKNGDLWLSHKFAQKFSGNRLQVQVRFALPFGIAKNAEKLISTCGIQHAEVEINDVQKISIYLRNLMEQQNEVIMMLFLYLAGYFVFRSMFQIAAVTDLEYYGRLKTLGMSPTQICKVWMGSGILLCAAGVVPGILFALLSGRIVLTQTGWNVSIEQIHIHVWLLVLQTAFLFFIVCRCSKRAASIIESCSPMEALHVVWWIMPSGKYRKKQTDRKEKRIVRIRVERKRSRRRLFLTKMGKSGRNVPFFLAAESFWKNRKWTWKVCAALAGGMFLILMAATKYHSFDTEKYLQETCISDFVVKEASLCGNVGGIYNERENKINGQMEREILALGGLQEYGAVFSKEVPYVLPKSVREQIRSFFIGEGEGLFHYMEPYTQWLQEYEEAISSGQCTMRIWGLDQDVFSMMEETDWILDGTWDPEQFAEGGYALAVGSDRSFKEHPNYSRGELVEVDGRTFKIMATVYLPDRMTEGGSYHMFVPEIVIPGTDFREMYPKTSIRKFYFNVKDQKEKDAEALLESYENRIGAPIAEESSYTLKQSFQKECVRSVFPELTAGVLLFFLGISGYINTQATMTLARTKEFAIFQSMGMSRRKIFQMILWECLCYVLISSVIAVTVGCLYSLTILKMSIRQELLSTGWVMTYRFTLFPLPILVLVGLITAVLLAVFCFCRSEKKSVVERIRQMEM